MSSFTRTMISHHLLIVLQTWRNFWKFKLQFLERLILKHVVKKEKVIIIDIS